VPVPPPPDDRRHRALLILLLLAREAELAPDQVDGPDALALVARVLTGAATRRHRRAASVRGWRPWMCRHRWAA
jgi:hypothetical protein